MAPKSTTVLPETELDRLAAEFGGSDVKGRTQAGTTLTYISIDGTIRRLNEVLGPRWSTRAQSRERFNDETKNWTVITELHLEATVDGVQKTAYGVGAMTNKDLDMAAKSALAEAIKKAGHQLGVALYLWDAEARKRAEKKMALAKNPSEAALKQAVFALAKEKDPTVTTAAQVAKVLGVKPGDLADKATLTSILTEAGVL